MSAMPRGTPQWPEWEGIGTLWEKPMMAVMPDPKHPVLKMALHPVSIPAYRTQLGGVGYVLRCWSKSEARKPLTIYRYDQETPVQWYVVKVLSLMDSSIELAEAKRDFVSYLMQALL